MRFKELFKNELVIQINYNNKGKKYNLIHLTIYQVITLTQYGKHLKMPEINK